jgi:hypothetical protein
MPDLIYPDLKPDSRLGLKPRLKELLSGPLSSS